MLSGIQKEQLHHAYLVEGEREKTFPEILKFVETLGVKTSGNPDFYSVLVDSFKIENAYELKSMESERSFSEGKKVFVISANTFLLEAQNALLKIFEEPKENTYFFVLLPDKGILLKTLLSRFYVISSKPCIDESLEKETEDFIKMPIVQRISFIKELLIEDKDEEENEDLVVGVLNSRAKALKFLNALEIAMSKMAFNNTKVSRTVLDTGVFRQIFKVREFLNQPGSSAKSLMESLALAIPVLK